MKRSDVRGGETIQANLGTKNKEGMVELNQSERLLEGTNGERIVQKEDKGGDMKAKKIQNSGDLMLIKYARSDHKDSRAISGLEGKYAQNFQEKSTSLKTLIMDCTNRISFKEGEEEGDKKKEMKEQWKRRAKMQGQGENQQKLNMKEEKEDSLRKIWRCELEPCYEMLKILVTKKKKKSRNRGD